MQSAIWWSCSRRGGALRWAWHPCWALLLSVVVPDLLGKPSSSSCHLDTLACAAILTRTVARLLLDCMLPWTWILLPWILLPWILFPATLLRTRTDLTPSRGLQLLLRMLTRLD